MKKVLLRKDANLTVAILNGWKMEISKLLQKFCQQSKKKNAPINLLGLIQ
jgi:hypothetical protein